MKKIFVHFIKIFTFLVILFGCKSKSDSNITYIKSTMWIYGDGYRIADFIKFDSTQLFSLQGDTILFRKIPKAIIVDYSKSNFNLQIKSLDNGKIGNYMDEIEMLDGN